MLSIEEIQKILPQRFPFLMIDKVTELVVAEKIVALKNVSINEGFFAGHFPSRPIMPGVLIIEAMAQASIMLFYSNLSSTEGSKMDYYLGSVKMRFLHPVFPGDQLIIIITPIKLISNVGLVNAVAKVRDKEVARGELSFSAKKHE